MTTELMVKARAEVYAAGAIRTRATRAEMVERRERLLELAREAQPASVRHIYYRAVVAGLVEKKESGYQKVQRELLAMRRSGDLPFHWIVDEGRRAHWPQVHQSPRSTLHSIARTYRRNPWQLEDLPRVEVWTESESLAGTLMPLRDDLAVPIFPIKGQASETFVWNAAQDYCAARQVVVLYAGDYDPAGLQIGVQLAGKLREYARDDIDLTFVRVGITDDQAEALQSLGTPPKQAHWIDFDGTRREFVGQAIEAEAVDAVTMRNLFRTTITTLAYEAAGYDVFAENDAIEDDERAQLQTFVRGWSA